MRLYEKSKLYVVCIYIYICIDMCIEIIPFVLEWFFWLTTFRRRKFPRGFIFCLKWLPFLFLESFCCWYQVEVRRRMEKQTFGDHSDRCRTLVLQSNEAPIGVVGMVQKFAFQRSSGCNFPKRKEGGAHFFPGYRFFCPKPNGYLGF